MRFLVAALALAAASGCTAIGAWVYDDPSFALSAVRVHEDSLDLVLLGCNRNDYDLLADAFPTVLTVDGVAMASGDREQPVFLATRDTSSFTVTMPLGRSLDVVVRDISYEVQATGRFHTPMGDRGVQIRIAGRVSRDSGGIHWSSHSPPCRPGSSTLPSQFDRRGRPVMRPSDEGSAISP